MFANEVDYVTYVHIYTIGRHFFIWVMRAFYLGRVKYGVNKSERQHSIETWHLRGNVSESVSQ